MTRHILSISDLEQEEFLYLIDKSVALSSDPFTQSRTLEGRSIGIYFRKTSTRTRTSFIVATTRLGGSPVVYGPNDLQTNTGESIEDTTRVLAGYLDALVVRTAGDPSELHIMAGLDLMPIVNAMTADEHPTQAISDLAMLTRQFARLSGLRVFYVGEGNNTAASLALAVSRICGLELLLLTPSGYGLSDSVSRKVLALSKRFGGKVSEIHDIPEHSERFDVIYTTRWQTTGTTKSDPLWRERFARFRVSNALMTKFASSPTSVFMHDLPAARGEDCDSAVIDGAQSIAFEQAKQKLYTAMAVLDWSIVR